MTAQLKQIQARFNKASKSYDSVASVQKEIAEFLVDKVLRDQNFSPQSILDLGTGTGYIPELLLPKFLNSAFYLNDISHEMLEKCQAKFASAKNIYYLHRDMLKLSTDIYDCIISSLALQWVDDLPAALELFHSRSSKVFAFSTLLDGTFQEWQNIINQYQPIKIINYPKAHELTNLCQAIKRADQSFEFWIIESPLSFDNPADFMRYLKSLGASIAHNPVNIGSLKKLLKSANQSLTVTYKIFCGIFKEEI